MNHQQSPHILVIDDDPDIHRPLAKYLKQNGFRVSVAGSGREMDKLLPKSNIDLIILDVMMPRKDGYTLCDELKTSDEYKDIVVVLLTAVTEAIKSTNYTHMGGKTTLANDFVPKPIDLDQLMEIVHDNL